jgi:hypothetical protein
MDIYSMEPAMFILPVIVFLFMIIANTAVVVIPFWFIFKKAGFSGALALLMLVPVANLVMLFVLAFAQWPALDKKRPIMSQNYDPPV